VTRAEAIAIGKERPAQALFDGPPDGIEDTNLRVMIARKAAALAWLKRRRCWSSWAALPIGLAVGLLVGVVVLALQGARVDPGAWGSEAAKGPLTNAIAASFFLSIAAWFGWVWRAYSRFPADSDPDLSLAQKLLDALQRESAGLASLQAQARSGEGYVLYLRTFGAEGAARTFLEAYSEELPKYAAAFFPEDGGMFSPSFARRHNDQIERTIMSRLDVEWNLHLDIVRAIAKRAPVLCLGNLQTDEGKMNDFRNLGVNQVALLKSDWWPVFADLADRAAIIVVFVSAETANLDRELGYLTFWPRPFLLVCPSDRRVTLETSPAYAGAMCSPNARNVVITGKDISPLEAALDGLPSPGASPPA
jgi:hypothetical protein